MITREQIPQVVGHPVHDAEGKKVGDAKHMYLDDKSGNPEWVTVKTGFFGSNETFVPTRSARLVQDHLEVPYPKEKIKGAPNVDVDSGGHLSVEEEQHLYRYYGIERTGGKGMSPDKSMGAAGAAGAAGAGGAAATKSSGDIGTDISRGRSAGGSGMDTTAAQSAGAGSGAAFASGRSGAPERAGAGDAEAEMMTRSEEEMHVKVERHASGKARLHKYVEVEEVEQTVPLRHEEVKLEREPLSASDREALRSGAEISEAERFVTLHEESPVVETEVVAKERVRMRVEEHVEQKKVHGRVRKERIEADMEGPTDTLPGDKPSRGGRPER
ncbi:DUF2382 domain-containing protein [Actinacidiphila bryophytorum]|uniref:PRC-barrel domain-containing protein n=1 Tax=Actinacidiphila bryophytorum TaxID=1436133 RepID=A0A9W4H731_9ACTN|nr:PRC and DUF2382 domain-containing protein [Actinacidiphila bryophytorum]MBM9439553.1 PRC and DUF2382 domain-containing protein [Actinacidiphila bryophytorum]MBN6544743.1 PRC and DUF2382 domain-containing protein [Actinacidiphila bryophytorum]CAG7655368.1 PRC-barrel domain-containing protein [Actinacidiphila bryophytorum]